MTVEQTFRTAMEAFSLPEGSNILLAYSGGADSSALLALSDAWCREKKMKLACVHVHHGIRGGEADRDAAFCRDECEKRGIPCKIEYADIPAMAKASGRGLEEEARIFRYALFDRLAENEHFSYVMTAHNGDDQAETMLFRFARGTSAGGLCGIPAERSLPCGAKLIRPLLRISKREIIGYCDEKRINYVFDTTNDDIAYRRNFLRKELIPRMEEINPSFLEAAARLASSLSDDEKCLDRLAEGFFEGVSDRKKLPLPALRREDRAILLRILRKSFASVSEATLENVHLDRLFSLVMVGKTGDALSLPGGIRAFLTKEALIFSDEPKPEATIFSLPLTLGETRSERPPFAILLEKKNSPQKKISDERNIYKLSIQAEVNSAKIKGILFARSRNPGDAYAFGGMTRKLKQLWNAKALSEAERYRLPVICDEEGIIWVPGFPTADRVKCEKTQDEEDVLTITCFFDPLF